MTRLEHYVRLGIVLGVLLAISALLLGSRVGSRDQREARAVALGAAIEWCQTLPTSWEQKECLAAYTPETCYLECRANLFANYILTGHIDPHIGP